MSPATQSTGRRGTRAISPLRDFLRTEAAGGVALVIATVTALLWANLGSGSYENFWHTDMALQMGTHTLSLDLRHWVNEALMTCFFLVVGAEIKREVADGELKDPRRAALPACAAIGGMVLPALTYRIIAGSAHATGWAIPMATDIAMAIGVLALLGPRVPHSLKLFLLALAIVDDIGSVVVIAVAYGEGVKVTWLLAALGSTGLLVVLRRLGIQAITSFVVVGTVLWYCLLRSGVHPTLAGVICGLLAPTRPFVPVDLVDESSLLDLSSFEAAAESVRIARGSVSVVEWLEHRLVPWSSYAVVPLFALANAGIPVGLERLTDALGSRVGLGVLGGLVFGKVAGIVAASWLAIRFGIATMPSGLGWIHLAGAGFLGGIGFTVSLFISELAFSSDAAHNISRIGILVGTIVSGVIGAAVLRYGVRFAQEPAHEPAT